MTTTRLPIRILHKSIARHIVTSVGHKNALNVVSMVLYVVMLYIHTITRNYNILLFSVLRILFMVLKTPNYEKIHLKVV